MIALSGAGPEKPQQLGDLVPYLSLLAGDKLLPVMVDAAPTYGQ
jgi:hypothetical protein